MKILNAAILVRGIEKNSHTRPSLFSMLGSSFTVFLLSFPLVFLSFLFCLLWLEVVGFVGADPQPFLCATQMRLFDKWVI